MLSRWLIPMAALVAATSVKAAPPPQISVQGVLRDNTGHLQSMPVDVTVRFYDAATNGNLLASYGPTTVLATDGLFTEVLSLDAAQVSALDGASALFMEIQAGTDTFPRQPVTSNVYALSASHALLADRATSADTATTADSATTATTCTTATSANTATTATTATTANNALELGGVAPNSYQRALATPDCGAANAIRGIDASGHVTCTPVPAGTVTSVGAAAPLSSSGGANPTISLTGTVPVANGGNRFGGAWATVYVGQKACLQQSGESCYLSNPMTGSCTCPTGFNAYPIAENYISSQNFTNCTWICVQ